MKNSEIIEVKLRNLTFIVILGFVITFALIIGLYVKDGKSTRDADTDNTNNTSETTEEYDVSKMNEVSVEEAVDLFDKDGLSVLYIGRKNCAHCVETVPVLNEVQKELNYTTQYLDLGKLMTENYVYNKETEKTELDWSGVQKDIKPLTDLITVKGTANGNEGKIGDLFYEGGYTPTIVIIKDGKAVDGFIGYKGVDSFKELVQKYQ